MPCALVSDRMICPHCVYWRTDGRYTDRIFVGLPDSQGGTAAGVKALKEYVEFKSDGEIQV